MAQFSVKIMRLTGSLLGENQHLGHHLKRQIENVTARGVGVFVAQGVQFSGFIERLVL
jgi:hypothetical protein